jgi:hypothetical protein
VTSTPRKNSSKTLLLEAKDNLQRMLTSITLTDDERAAVDDGQAALDQLLARLADIPAPTGAVPHQPGIQPRRRSCRSSASGKEPIPCERET